MRIKSTRKKEEFKPPYQEEEEKTEFEKIVINLVKFLNPQDDGLFLEAGNFKSPNFVKKNKGWALEEIGKAWFQEIYIGSATNYLSYDVSNGLELTGTITATAGSIGGWTISADALYLDGATDAVSSGMASGDYPFYAGKKYADRATAPFRVTPAGALVASSATITGSLTTGAGSNIDGQYLGNLTVATGALANLAITAGKIANATITATQIANTTITAGKIANATITATQISNSAGITGGQIANATITTTQISNSAGIVGGQIDNLTITAGNIANLTITTSQIANSTIVGGDIAQNTITGGTTGNIALTSITANNIAAATITGTQIAATTIAAGNIIANTITSNELTTGAFVTTTANITDGIITNAKINDLSANKITAGTITSQAIILGITATAGDGYIAGGTYNIAAWTATGGFILGIDDSDSDKEKFFIGDATTSLDWNVTTLNTLTVKGAINITNPSTVRSDINVANGADVTADNTAANITGQGNLAILNTVSTTECDTTIIDGGKIVTGLLTANNIQTGSLDAQYIGAGTITSKAITLAVSAGTGDVKLQAGKTDFGDTTAGFILGIDDSDSDKAKFEIGNATDYFKWDGSNVKILCSAANALEIEYGSDILLNHGGDIKFASVIAPTACTATLVATAVGNVDAGTHSYKVTYVNGAGETELSAISNIVTTDASHKQVNLTSIPVSASSSVISRKIYRTKAGGTSYYLLTTISNNTTTTYTDNIADASLGVDGTGRDDTTFGKIYVVTGASVNEVAISLGVFNSFVGLKAGNSSVNGRYNSAFGTYSLYQLTTGAKNTAGGVDALYSNTTGNNNTAFGEQSLDANISGDNNTACGYGSLYVNTGDDNTAYGGYSLVTNTTGDDNTAIGLTALYLNLSGNNNTAIGNYSGYTNSTGSSNVFVGYCAGSNAVGSNELYIDNLDRSTAANDKAFALIYGVFAAATANQKITINGLFNLSVSKTPASAGASGTAGDICWDSSYIYICTATDTWKRVAIATW